MRRVMRALIFGGLAAAMLTAIVPVSAASVDTNGVPAAPGSRSSEHVDAPVTRQTSGDAIARPTRAYRRATCKLRFDRRAVGTSFTKVRGCANQVTISRRARRAQVPTTWRTWSPRPFSEDPTPAVGILPRDNIRFTFRRTVRVAGFEIEPNTFSTARVTVRFFARNGRVLGTIRRNVDGNAGARLFALQTRRPLIKRMSVQVEDDRGFAVAQIRAAR